MARPPTRKQVWGLEPYHPLVDKVRLRERLTNDEIRSIDDIDIARIIIHRLQQWDLDWGRRP